MWKKNQAKYPPIIFKIFGTVLCLANASSNLLEGYPCYCVSEHRVEYNCYHYTAKRRNLLHFCYFQGKTSFRTYISRKRAALAERLNLSSVCLHLLRGLLLTGMTKASQL